LKGCADFFAVRVPRRLYRPFTTFLKRCFSNRALTDGEHETRDACLESLQRRDLTMFSFVRSLRRAAGSRATEIGLRPAVACLVGLSCSGAALADDWYTGATRVVPNDQWIVAVDASATATSNQSQFLYGAATFALGGTLQQSGFRLKLEGLGGDYGYNQNADGTSTQGRQYEGGALAGYQQVWKNATIAYYVGVNVRENTVPAADPVNSAIGTRVGFKAAIDAYARPTDLTMVSAYGSYSTAYDAYFARFRAGYSVLGVGYLGPELALLGDDYFGQTRLGAHFSGVQLGALQFGVAGGYVWGRDYKDGYYGTLELRAGF
jgi:hypothetical protein